MMVMTIQSNQLPLPEVFAKRFQGKRVEILDTKEGGLLKPVDDAIELARGSLMGSALTSERFSQLKQREKE